MRFFTAVLIRSKSSAVSTRNSSKTLVPIHWVTWHKITGDLACQKCRISCMVICEIWSSLLAWLINPPVSMSHKLCPLCGISGSHNAVIEVFSCPYVTQHYLVVSTYWDRLSGPMKMRPIGCPVMSAAKYQALLLNIPEEQNFICPLRWNLHSLLQPLLHKTQCVVCFLLGNSLGSAFYMPTFQNTLSVPSS